MYNGFIYIYIGQGMVCYLSSFNALLFQEHYLRTPLLETNLEVAIGLLLSCPFFVLAGSLSDRYGRKPIIFIGLLLSVIYF